MKILAVFLIVLIACSGFGIQNFFLSLPKPAKVAVGIVGLAWTFTWLFDPIVIWNEITTITVPPFIFITPEHAEKNWIWNHEYEHYCQFAFLGPLLPLLYPVFALYSIITTGDMWTANPFEYIRDNHNPPAWTPLLEVGK